MYRDAQHRFTCVPSTRAVCSVGDSIRKILCIPEPGLISIECSGEDEWLFLPLLIVLVTDMGCGGRMPGLKGLHYHISAV